jgi:ApaG protein
MMCFVRRGPGVIGQKPVLGPGVHFEYTSACPLPTSTGVMKGVYECVVLKEKADDDEEVVEVIVAPFQLTTSVVGEMEA